MATGLRSDFIIYQEQFQSGLVERTAQMIDLFNERSNGAIVFDKMDLMGDYSKEAFFPLISSLVARQDLTSVSAATAVKPTQAENIGVKLNQKIGPIDLALPAIKRIKMSPEAYSIALGEMVGAAIMERMVNLAIKGAVAAITNNSACVYDVSTTEKLTSINLIEARALFGDASGRIACWVMHSKPWHDLLKNQVAEGLDTISGVALARGSVATFGLPQVVTDDASLVNSAKYYNLGLVEGAVRVTESEGRQIVTDLITGLEQLVYRIQGEIAFNLAIKGFQWDTTNGGVNPADATLATTTNWDQIATSDKDTAGVCAYTL